MIRHISDMLRFLFSGVWKCRMQIYGDEKCVGNIIWKTWGKKRLFEGHRQKWKTNIKINCNGIFCGLRCLRLETNGGFLLGGSFCTFEFHTRRGISWLAVQLLASQERFFSVEIFAYTCKLFVKHRLKMGVYYWLLSGRTSTFVRVFAGRRQD